MADAPPELWRAAVHESGHAIAGVVVGAAVRSASITPAGGGVVSFDWTGVGVRERITVTLAGPAAELRFAPGIHSDPFGVKNPAGDWNEMERELAALPEDERTAAWRACMAEARAIVADYAGAVHRLARRLLAAGAAGPADVDTAIALRNWW